MLFNDGPVGKTPRPIYSRLALGHCFSLPNYCQGLFQEQVQLILVYGFANLIEHSRLNSKHDIMLELVVLAIHVLPRILE